MAKDEAERRNVNIGVGLLGAAALATVVWPWADGLICAVLAGGVVLFLGFHVVAWLVGEAELEREARRSDVNIGKRPTPERKP